MTIRYYGRPLCPCMAEPSPSERTQLRFGACPLALRGQFEKALALLLRIATWGLSLARTCLSSGACPLASMRSRADEAATNAPRNPRSLGDGERECN